MSRFCCICFVVVASVFQTLSQAPTLHNTLAKGTLSVTGGIHFFSVAKTEVLPVYNYAFGLNYCFKNRYTLGVEGLISSSVFLGATFQRNDLLLKSKLGRFKVTSMLGLSGGNVLLSPTGFYFTGSLGIRLEVARRMFLEVKESGGYLTKNNVELRTTNLASPNVYGCFSNTQIKLGIFLFINTLDKCGTCPKW